MKCLTPIYPHGEPVPCGHCYACQTNHRNEWDLRLRVQHLHSNHSAFITLTYADEFLPFQNLVSIDDHQQFVRNLRSLERKTVFKYYMVGEYGERFGRPHMHYILFYDSDIDIIRLVNRCWYYGFTDVGSVTNASIHYVTKWHINPKHRVGESLEKHGFAKSSKGIGSDLLSRLNSDNVRPTFVIDGKRLPVSRYYRKKIGFVVEKCETLFDYISRKYETDDVFKINSIISDLKESYDKKLSNPRKSIF